MDVRQGCVKCHCAVYLLKEITLLDIDILLPEATARVGGFSDACHSLTAATTVAVGREGQLLEEMERILKRRGCG